MPNVLHWEMNVFIPHGNYIFLRKKDRPLVEIPLDTDLSWSLLVKKENLFQCILNPMKVMFFAAGISCWDYSDFRKKKNIYIYPANSNLKVIQKRNNFSCETFEDCVHVKDVRTGTVCLSVHLDICLFTSLSTCLSICLLIYLLIQIFSYSSKPSEILLEHSASAFGGNFPPHTTGK